MNTAFPLVLTMIASFILGMGLTTTADYIVLATFVLPAIVKMGADPLAAHLFAFYFSSISGITPPVALASFAAAAIAGAGLWETGLTAIRIGIAAFLIPYVFVYSPEIMMQGSPLGIVLGTTRAVLGVACLAGAAQGWLLVRATWLERLLLLGGAFFFVWPALWADALALVLTAVVVALHLRRRALARAADVVPDSTVVRPRREGWVTRRRASLARAELEAEPDFQAQTAPAAGPSPTTGQWLGGWALLAAVGLGFSWLGARHLHILTFNTFLGATLVLAFATLAAFSMPWARRAP